MVASSWEERNLPCEGRGCELRMEGQMLPRWSCPAMTQHKDTKKASPRFSDSLVVWAHAARQPP